MPFYEFECPLHGRLTVRQPMFSEHTANCPDCGLLAERRFSPANFRFAEPLTVYQDLGGHKGYQEIGWKADSGVSPKAGQAYKTPKQVDHEYEDSKNEEARLCR